MKRLLDYRVLGCLVVGVVFRSTAPLPAQTYSVTDLGTLEGGPDSVAYAINEVGEVVGASRLPPNGFPRHAFLWVKGNMIDLGTLGGGGSAAVGINNQGQVVGGSDIGGGFFEAFLWQDGQMTGLDAPFQSFSGANAINDAGQIVGMIDLTAFLWEDGVWTELDTLPGFTSSVARGINSAGDVVGGVFSACFCPTIAVKWVGREVIELGLAPGFESSGARDQRRGADCGDIIDGHSLSAPRHTVGW